MDLAMSNRHRHQDGNDVAGTSHGGHGTPGKRSRTSSLPARPKADAAARDDDDGAIGPGDLENLPPVIAQIIDLAARENGTQLIVSKGRAQDPTHRRVRDFTQNSRQVDHFPIRLP